MIRTFIFILIFISISFSSNAQEDVATVLKKYTASLEKAYTVGITYKIYKGHTTNVPEEVQQGVFCKDGDRLYTKIGDVELLNLPTIHLKINHIERAILVADGMSAPSNISFNLEEFSKYLTTKANDKGNTIQLVFTPNTSVTQIPFEKLEVTLEKGSYRILKQVFYYTTKMNFSNTLQEDDIKKVKLEVVFKNYKGLHSKDIQLFDTRKYISIVSKAIKPSHQYKNYEIVNIKH